MIQIRSGLAENPGFYCELIRLLFKSKKVPQEDQEPDNAPKDQKELAPKAFRLLREWRTPPGTKRDGSFDGNALATWIDALKRSSTDSGHWDIAANQLGEVLYYAPRDTTGLWIDSVCNVLDSSDGAKIHSGLNIEIFNSRGAF